MNLRILLLTICCTICACSNSPSNSNPVVIQPTFAPVSPSYIKGLSQRIADIPKGESIPISQLLSRLGLWKYRKEIQPGRRTNVVSLNLNDTETEFIVFFAEEEPMAITRDHLTQFPGWWELYIKDLHIDGIMFRSVRTNIK